MTDKITLQAYMDWLKIADKDLGRVETMLEEGDAEAAGFFLQQALEKYLKAFLIKNNWKLRKIHELDSLLDDAVKQKPQLEKFRDLCERVSGYYYAERYPPLGETGLTVEEVRTDLKEASDFVSHVFPKNVLSSPAEQ